MSLWNAVCSVILCYSVRNRTHPLDEIMPMRFAGESFLSQRTFLSLTDLTDLTELFCALFRTHRRPSAYREHGGLTPNPSPNGEGSSMWGYPFWPATDRKWAAKYLEDMEGYLGDHSPLHSERGWGWGFCWPSAYRGHRALLLSEEVKSLKDDTQWTNKKSLHWLASNSLNKEE